MGLSIMFSNRTQLTVDSLNPTYDDRGKVMTPLAVRLRVRRAKGVRGYARASLDVVPSPTTLTISTHSQGGKNKREDWPRLLANMRG